MEKRSLVWVGGILLLLQAGIVTHAQESGKVRERDVRAHMEFLASDALRGRGSMSGDELIAAEYIASQLRQFNVEPAGDLRPDGSQGYIQTVDIRTFTFASLPILRVPSAGIEWMHGKEFVVGGGGRYTVQGPLRRLQGDEKPAPGSIAMFEATGDGDPTAFRRILRSARSSGAAAVLVEFPSRMQQYVTMLSERAPEFLQRDSGSVPIIFLTDEAAARLRTLTPGVLITFGAPQGPTRVEHTWNVIGLIRGADDVLASQVISLTAHMDHLGVRGGSEPDSIFNGADDDASGTTAVLELARTVGAGPAPKRTVYVVLFGSEERGGFGAQHFLKTMPFSQSSFVADLQFEMIGRPDTAVRRGTLWLTGYERSDLGPELARHGARLVADPHPEENFFQRSDNYTLARMGIIAHTVSSYGLHKEYHRANDDLGHIDFGHMTASINSLIAPVQWLVNSTFVPSWKEGMKP